MKRSIVAIAMALGLSSQAHAALVVYSGADDEVFSLADMTNSVAAAASFDAATPGSTLIDFESALPAGVAIAGGNITSNSGCGQRCGFNTTAGGQNFLNLFGGVTTFTFTTGVDAFGFYITGLQTEATPQQTLTFSDGSIQVIDTPTAIAGGGAFIGFTDFGKSVVSVTYDATIDIVSIDDVRLHLAGAGAPEPATWAMMLLGFGGLGGALRNHRRALLAA